MALVLGDQVESASKEILWDVFGEDFERYG